VSKVLYALRETAANLRRNLTLTIATFVTVAVALTLSGAALLMRNGVNDITARWRGGVEFIVMMKPDATKEQIDAVGTDLKANPIVDANKLRFFDKAQSFEEAKIILADTPTLIDALGLEGSPTQWKVVPTTPDPDVIRGVADQFQNRPGVLEVIFPAKYLQRLKQLTGLLQGMILGAAITLLVVSALLILNTIRLAMFARRREIEVQKLVGATNWFIRVPFMLEGLVQGFVGALLAFGGVWGLNRLFSTRVAKANEVDVLSAAVASSGEVRGLGILLLVIGVVIGTVGSGLAVSRFLDV
jgi:cell division transport system permease protein